MTRLAIPWYVHPAEAPDQWQRLTALADRIAFVVVNVNNGPGPADDPYYPEAIAGLRAGGVSCLGYVDTSYGRRGIVQVAADVRTWLERYDVAGIMFDQVAPGPDCLGYNRMLATIARRAGAKTLVANPGVEPCRELLDLFDVTCVFENDVQAYDQRPAVEHSIGPAKVWHLVYGVRTETIDSVLDRAEEQGAGLVFVTDRSGPHPWTGLPSTLVEAGPC